MKNPSLNKMMRDMEKKKRKSPVKKDIIIDPMGQWRNPGQPVVVPTPSGQITMEGVPYPVYGMDETGYGQMMYPGGGYVFPGQMVYEIPYPQMYDDGGFITTDQTTIPPGWIPLTPELAKGRYSGDLTGMYYNPTGGQGGGSAITYFPPTVESKPILPPPPQLKMVRGRIGIEPLSVGTPSINRQPTIQPNQSGDYVLRFSELNSDGQNQPRELFFKSRKEADQMMDFLQKENDRRYSTGTYYSNLTTQGNYRQGGWLKQFAPGGSYDFATTLTTTLPPYMQNRYPVASDIQGRGMSSQTKAALQPQIRQELGVKEIMGTGVSRPVAQQIRQQQTQRKSNVTVGQDRRTDYERKVAQQKVDDVNRYRENVLGIPKGTTQRELDEANKYKERLAQTLNVGLTAAPILEGALSLGARAIPKAGQYASRFTAPGSTTTREATIQVFNPKNNIYETRLVNVPEEIIPGRSFQDVQHKMKNLRKDLGIGPVEHFLNKNIPGFAKPIPLYRDFGVMIDDTGRLFDANTRYWLNKQYGFTPSPTELIQPVLSQYAKSFGKTISQEPIASEAYGKLLFRKDGGGLPLAQDGWWDDIVGAVKTVGDIIVPTNVRSLGRMGLASVGLPTGGNFVRKEDFTKQQLKFIYDAALRAKQRTGQLRGGTMYSDYGKDYGDLWKGRKNIQGLIGSYTDPGFSVATTLGRFTYNINDDGSISVSDIYDFNNEKKGIVKEALKTVDNMVGQDNRRNVNFNISSQDFRQFGGLQKMKGGGNANVRSYQAMLNQKYNAGLAEDGKWGSKTQAAYEKYILKKGKGQSEEQRSPLMNRYDYLVAESTAVPRPKVMPTPLPSGKDGPKLPKDVKPVNGYVDLSKYNIDPLSKEGIELAKTISAKYPSAKFICTAKGCAEIARKGAQAYGDDFGWSNAWGFGNENPIEFSNPAYEGMIGSTSGPLPDPRTFAVPADVLNLPGGRMVGLNRKNNRVGFTPATTREMADDSYDYANQELYPGSRGYEHIGYSLGNNMLMHGTGANSEHPAYYVIDNMRDGIGLSGYGKYEPVETMTPASGLSRAWSSAKKFVTGRKGGGTTYSGGLWYKEGGMPCYECGGMYQSGNVVGSQNSEDPLTKYNREMNYRNKLNLLNQTAPTFFMNPDGSMGMRGAFSNMNQSLPAFPMTNYNNNLQLLNQNNPYYMMGADGRPVMRGGVPPGILPSPSSLGVKTSFMDGGDIPNYMQDPNPLYNFGGYFPQGPRFQMGGGNMIPYPSYNNYIPNLSEMKKGGINIKPSKRGTFTAAATKAGMGVQEFASKVLSAPEGKYSPAMRKKANFARNAAGWKKEEGGIVEGQIIDVTPDMLEQLKLGGYTFEIVND